MAESLETQTQVWETLSLMQLHIIMFLIEARIQEHLCWEMIIYLLPM